MCARALGASPSAEADCRRQRRHHALYSGRNELCITDPKSPAGRNRLLLLVLFPPIET